LLKTIAFDHREMYEYYQQYLDSTGNLDNQKRWSNQLFWTIATHSVGEELAVYPLLEKHLGEEGKKLAEHDREDHQYVKDRVYKLEGMRPGTEEFDALLKDTMAHLRTHGDSEEQEDLPSLEKAIGVDASVSAARDFQRAKKMAPTHSHPSAPAKPPGETVAGFLSLPMDKLKDMFMKAPTEDMKREAASNLPK